MPFQPYSAKNIPIQSWLNQADNDRPRPIVVDLENINQILNPPGIFNSCTLSDFHGIQCKRVRFLLKTTEILAFSPIDEEPFFFWNIRSSTYFWPMTGVQDVLSARCLSAGHIYFDKENRICGIDNLCPEFTIPVDSLQLALSAMRDQSMPMTEEITVSSLNPRLEKDQFKVLSSEIKVTSSIGNPLAPSPHLQISRNDGHKVPKSPTSCCF